MKEDVYEIRIRNTDTLTKEQQNNVKKQLDNISGSFNYVGYSRVSYAIDKKLSKRDSPVLKIIKIEPIEGTVIDEFDRLDKMIGGFDNIF